MATFVERQDSKATPRTLQEFVEACMPAAVGQANARGGESRQKYGFLALCAEVVQLDFMLRILVDARPINPGLTGIGRYAQNLLLSLDLLDRVEVTALVGPEGAEMMAGLRRVGLLVVEHAGDEWTQVKLPALLEELNAEVLHSPLFVLPSRTSCPAVITIHDVIPRARPDLTSRDFLTFFEAHVPQAIRVSSRVVTVSNFSAHDFSEHFPEAREKLRVIPEPVSPMFRRDSPARVADVQRTYSLRPGYVLFLGTLDRRKGLESLLDAWALVKNKCSGAPDLVVAGGAGGAELDLKAAIQGRGLGRTVVTLGRVVDRDLAALYSGASVFVFPSEYEGFGLPVLEAMACGLPVVTTRTSSIPEVAGDAALLVGVNAPEELSHALIHMLSSHSVRQDHARRGYKRAAQFSVASQAGKLDKLYAELSGERR